MILYAGNITHLTDARYFSAWNVDWMGYQFDSSEEHALDTDTFAAISEWVEGPETVIECGLLDASELSDLVANTDAARVKFHPLQDPDKIADAPIGAAEKIAHFVIEQNTSPQEWRAFYARWSDLAQYFIIDYHKNAVELAGTFELTKSIFMESLSSNTHGAIIALPPGMVVTAERLGMYGIDGVYVAGSMEEKTGVKVYDHLDEIMEQFAWDD